jgi:hypothetical protein
MAYNLLNNTTEEIVEINRKRWTIAVSVILVLVLMPLLCHLLAEKELSQEEIERKISASENLKRIDRLCNELPKPEGFNFVDKSISGNSFASSISYHYRSAKRHEDVITFYSNFLKANGWVIGESNYYEKGNQQISIFSVAFPNANYSIYCAEVSKQKN